MLHVWQVIPRCLHLRMLCAVPQSTNPPAACAPGPNNQLVSLKEVLMLGRLLNRTVIIPDIKTHSSERGGSVPFRIGFKEVRPRNA